MGLWLVLGWFADGQLPIQAAATMQPYDLRCEYAINPLGVDVAQPRLFWKLQSEQRAQAQTAYQILVASQSEFLSQNKGDLWDSGQMKSDATTHIRYAGKPLVSSQPVFWKVRVWSRDNQVSEWSPSASWTMGLLKETDWQAKWISAEALQKVPRSTRGYHAAETPQSDEVKWIQVDLGKTQPITEIRLHPMRHQAKDGFGFPIRFRVEADNNPEFTQPFLIADQTAADYVNPGYRVVSFKVSNITARYVRITATSLWLRDRTYCFALQQLEVISAGNNVAQGKKVAAKDSVENYGWGKTSLTDGVGMVGVDTTESTTWATLSARREFNVKPGLQHAVVHVCGLGQYEMSVNGKKVGADLLSPGWTKYDKTCLYDSYDLTSGLRAGPNAVGLLLGNGMYNVTAGRYTKFRGSHGPLKAIAQIQLTYQDGTREIIGTGPDWQVHSGPITFSCIYGGEDYDARLESAGWNQAGFKRADWIPAWVTKGPGGILRGQSSAAPPLQAIETIKPASVKTIKPGIEIYDLGQNAPIMPRLQVRGSAGSVVKITPAELLKNDGSVDRQSSGGGMAYWKYTLAGTGKEDWFPKFWYHGCRYLQVERQPAANASELPTVEQLEGVVVHTASAPIGEFACSNDLFNRIRTLIRWAQRANLVSVITDCPHRERLGWLEQYHLNGPSLRYEWDLSQLFAKGMVDMADAQLDNGLVPDIAPEYTVFKEGFRDSPEWGSAYVLVPWQQYEWTGDVELLRHHYEGMKKYVAYLGTRAKEHIVSHGLGDWYDIGPKPPGAAQLTPRALTATAFYYYDTCIVAWTARLLGKKDEAIRYETLANEIRAAFNREFFKTDTHQYATGSQCANAIPLVMNLALPEHRAGLIEALAADVRTRNNSLTAGDVGYRYLLRALADGGRNDVILDMNNQSERPGYGYQLKQGATSLTEAWDARRGSSHNHFMLGHIMEWFYQDLAGIGIDPTGPGFKKIILRPQPVGDITWARASLDSIRGKIISDWKIETDQFHLKVTIPPNTTATVYMPARSVQEVYEAGKPVEKSPGIRFLRGVNNCMVYEIASGTYHFRAKYAR
jgi:hypothetical protein